MIIGAFSFVNRDILDNVIAVGVPVKVIKNVSRPGEISVSAISQGKQRCKGAKISSEKGSHLFSWHVVHFN